MLYSEMDDVSTSIHIHTDRLGGVLGRAGLRPRQDDGGSARTLRDVFQRELTTVTS